MTDSLKEGISTLREEGLSYKAIVNQLGCAIGTVAYHVNATTKAKSQKNTKDWRREFKRKLKTDAGGRCEVCSYDRCLEALQFHHRDPSQKLFEISDSVKQAKRPDIHAEVKKCALLCANCHAEVHAGITTLPINGH